MKYLVRFESTAVVSASAVMEADSLERAKEKAELLRIDLLTDSRLTDDRCAEQLEWRVDGIDLDDVSVEDVSLVERAA